MKTYLRSEQDRGESHSIMGFSSLDRREVCAGSAYLEQDKPNTTSKYSAEGTVAHELAAWCLTQNLTSPLGRLGDTIHQDGHAIQVTVEMVEAVEDYVRRTRELAEGHTLLVEQQLNIGWLVGLEGDTSTADVIIIANDGTWIIVRDLKYGKGVPVNANETLQPVGYGAAAVAQFDLLIDAENLKEVIVEIDQPRLAQPVTRRVIPYDELVREVEKIKAISARCHEASVEYVEIQSRHGGSPQRYDEWETKYTRASDDGCKFCKAKATCRTAIHYAENGMAMKFDEVEPKEMSVKEYVSKLRPVSINAMLPKLEFIEELCAAIRAEGYRLAEQQPELLPDWKLIDGRAGARRWEDDEKAEETMRSMRLKSDEMYVSKIISPTKAEELLKENPRKWAKLSGMVTRNPPKPTLVPVTHKSPARVALQHQFDEVPAAPAADNSDLI